MSSLKSFRVLVTPTSYGKHDPTLKTTLEETVGEVIYNDKGRPLTSEELQALLPEIDGYIAGLDFIDGDALASTNRLKVIARYGAGVDRVDLIAARAKDIIVTNTPGANASAVAELTIGLMLAAARNIPMASNATRQGEWPRLSGISLEGKTIGLLGFGAIGREVARRLQGFGCNIIVHDPFVNAETAKSYSATLKDQTTVISQSDFLSLHVPVVDDTRRMVNTVFLEKMKSGSILINTARGELIDEGALLQALQSGHLHGAALDAFSEEPPDANHPLLQLPQVIATPHTGAHTDGATNAMGRIALNDCLAVLRGNTPEFRVV